jgi:hypothetical protein
MGLKGKRRRFDRGLRLIGPGPVMAANDGAVVRAADLDHPGPVDPLPPNEKTRGLPLHL